MEYFNLDDGNIYEVKEINFNRRYFHFFLEKKHESFNLKIENLKSCVF